MKGDKFMTAVEFAERMEYDYSTIVRWLLAARNRQNMTYAMLARLTGMATSGLGAMLEPIQSYCILNNLPPLTVLVVQTESGLPGSGFTGAAASDLAAAQSQVFAFDWLAHGNPGPILLEEAAYLQPSCGPQYMQEGGAK
jgi:hypothetical protein